MQKEPSKAVKRAGAPSEPILGPGAGYLFGELLMIAACLGLLILVSVAGIYLKGEVYNLLYGEAQGTSHSPEMKPGETRVIDGVTIKRIN